MMTEYMGKHIINIAQDRSGVLPEVTEQYLVRVDGPAKADLDAVLFQHHCKRPCQFDHLCDNRCNGSAGDAHFRKETDAEDESGIQNDVDDDGNGTDDSAQYGFSAVFQNAQVDLRNAEQQIGHADYPKINSAVLDENRIRGECTHQQFREKCCADGKGKGEQHGKCQTDAQRLFHCLFVLNAPVLSGKDRNAGSNGKQKQGIYELHLSCQGYCREGILVDKAQHKCV